MRTFILLICCLFSSLSWADQSVNQSLTVQANGTVNISLVEGNITIVTWNKSEVSVVGKLDIEDDDEFIFETKGDETTIRVELDKKSRWGWGSSTDNRAELTITVPVTSAVFAGTVSADLGIHGLQAKARLKTVSGDILADNLSASIDLESVSGDIVIKDSHGEIELSSVSGDIFAKGEATAFEAKTVSGDIEAIIGTSERVELDSVSGDIEVNLELASSGRLDAETVSGDIDVMFNNKALNARFNLETGPGGDIDNNITNDRADKSYTGAGDVRFKVGNGDAYINIDTMSGTIDVRN